jgi:hypothetical protein
MMRDWIDGHDAMGLPMMELSGSQFKEIAMSSHDSCHDPRFAPKINSEMSPGFMQADSEHQGTIRKSPPRKFVRFPAVGRTNSERFVAMCSSRQGKIDCC